MNECILEPEKVLLALGTEFRNWRGQEKEKAFNDRIYPEEKEGNKELYVVVSVVGAICKRVWKFG